MKFNIVGAINTFVGTAVFLFLVFLDIHYSLALFFDYLVGMLVSFYLNKNYTFCVEKDVDISMILRAIQSTISIMVLNFLILFIFIDIYHLNIYFSQLFALIVISISSFLFYKLYIFGKR